MSSPHAELRDLAPGYVLGILDADEKAVFEPHMRECSSCAAEVASLVSIVEALAASAPQKTPPAELRQRVLAAALESTPSVDPRAAIAIIARPDVVRVDMKGQGAAADTTARVLWSRQHGLAFSGTTLPVHPAGHQYVIWVINGVATLKVGVLREYDGGVVVFETPRDMPRPLEVLITVEGAGEGEVPGGEVVLAGVVPHPS